MFKFQRDLNLRDTTMTSCWGVNEYVKKVATQVTMNQINKMHRIRLQSAFQNFRSAIFPQCKNTTKRCKTSYLYYCPANSLRTECS